MGGDLRAVGPLVLDLVHAVGAGPPPWPCTGQGPLYRCAKSTPRATGTGTGRSADRGIGSNDTAGGPSGSMAGGGRTADGGRTLPLRRVAVGPIGPLGGAMAGPALPMEQGRSQTQHRQGGEGGRPSIGRVVSHYDHEHSTELPMRSYGGDRGPSLLENAADATDLGAAEILHPCCRAMGPEGGPTINDHWRSSAYRGCDDASCWCVRNLPPRPLHHRWRRGRM